MLGSFLSVHPDKNGRMSYNSYSLEKEILYLLREEQFELLGNEGSVLDSNKIIYDVNNKEYTLSNVIKEGGRIICLLYTSPSPRDGLLSRMPSSA